MRYVFEVSRPDNFVLAFMSQYFMGLEPVDVSIYLKVI